MEAYKLSKNLEKKGLRLLSLAVRNKDKLHIGPSNCWGTTRFVLEDTPVRRYFHDKPMLRWIKKNTRRVFSWNKEEGDILVIKKGFLFKELIHTAVYIGNGKYFHQEGYQGIMKINSLKEILKTYSYETPQKYYFARKK